ncbi:MAG: TRAP transporter small permease [Brachymonas sp.]|nr:TRAP transporter small permease [Brachymonas sp.]
MLSILKKISYALGMTGSLVALAIGLMTTASVLSRALANTPIPGDIEITQMGIALAISLCLPWCQLRNANIIVDFFTQNISGKSRQWLDALGCFCLVAMYWLLAWRTGAGAVSVREAGETSMIVSLPMWWAYAALAPGLAVAGVIVFVQGFMLLGGRDLAELQGEAA